MAAPLLIGEADGPGGIEAARGLMRAYVDGIGIDLGFQSVEHELATLPGAYAAPRGALLLARGADGAALGCVALRPLSAECCEMKRLYVAPGARGLGAGRALAEAILARARAIGYREMVLDALPSFEAAIALYERLGFEAMPPYYDNPVPGARFLRRALR